MADGAWQRLRGWLARSGAGGDGPTRIQRTLRDALRADLHDEVRALALRVLEAAPQELSLAPVVELLQRSLDTTGHGRAWVACALYLRTRPGVPGGALCPQDRGRLAWLERAFERAGEAFTEAGWHAHAGFAFGHGGLYRKAVGAWQALAARESARNDDAGTGLAAFHEARARLALRDLEGARSAWERARQALAEALAEARFLGDNDRAWDHAMALATLEGDAGRRGPWLDARKTALTLLADDGMAEEHARESLALVWQLARLGAPDAELVPFLEGDLRGAFRRGAPERYGLLADASWAAEERRAERLGDLGTRDEARRQRAALASQTPSGPRAVTLPDLTLAVPPYVSDALALDLGADLAETACGLLLLGPAALGAEGRAAALALAVDAWTSPDDAERTRRLVGRAGAVGAYELLVPLLGLVAHPEVSVRRAVAEVAGAFRFRRAVDLLERGASDPDETVRHAALASLGGLGVEAAVARLDRLRAGATDPELRRAALWALGAVGTASAVARLLAVLARGSDDEARLAAELLVRSAVPEIEALLGAARDRYGDPQGRITAVVNARQKGSPPTPEPPGGEM
ncbi:MAG: HEAT repeat domain-containing protein [Deltaproteobacteria bacterium]|nr:HEAT repeat domain-containing protein [Deltaproteobacteria bacterium]